MQTTAQVHGSIALRWAQRLAEFAPGFFEYSPALRELAGRCAVILHGSTTLGVDDACSDLDLWVLAPAKAVGRAEAIAGSRFFSFKLEGKEGHFNLEAADEAIERVRRCDMERIAELRCCHVLADPGGVGGELVALARRPMSEAVRRAWFCYHYVEMRGYHRNCDNPIERGDPAALLLGLTPTLAHALRAAMVLDGQPYPYIKWLGSASAQTPTGRLLAPLVNDVFDLLAADGLRHPGPERAHPLGLKLRQMRAVLIDSARAAGIDEPWLTRWWAHMTQARESVARVGW